MILFMFVVTLFFFENKFQKIEIFLLNIFKNASIYILSKKQKVEKFFLIKEYNSFYFIFSII